MSRPFVSYLTSFTLASAWVVVHALTHDLRNGLIGLAALLTALPVYALWKRARGAR